MKDSISTPRLISHIKQLEFAGGHYSRVTFTSGNDSGFHYIKKEFEALNGLQVTLDTFLITGATSPYDTIKLYNVVATIKGKDTASGSYIIGAHYDCSGSRMGSTVWNQQWNTMHAKGADDNATGVAALLEIARLFSDSSSHFKPFHTIKLIAFAAEEYGIVYPGHHWGSIVHAQKAVAAGEIIQGMISLDMIGYNNNYDYTTIVSNSASQLFGQKVLQARNIFNLNLTMNNPPFPEATYSDHASFWENGYNAILIIENAPPWTTTAWYQANPFYHTTGDSFATLNMSLVSKVTQLNLVAIASLATKLNVTNIDERTEKIPEDFTLHQNYPNPFNPTTIISYQLSASGNVSLKIFDMLGNEVATLIDNEWKEAGTHNFQFSPDAHEINSQLPSGVYLYKLSAGRFVQTRKMVFLK